MIPVIGAAVVISLLGPIGKSLREPQSLKLRPKIKSSKIVRNHLGTHQEHPGGVFDDLGAVFWTPGSPSKWVSVVKTE